MNCISVIMFLQRGAHMTSKEVVKQIMEQNELTNTYLASRLNITPAALWKRLNYKQSKDMSVSVLTTMLRALDYKLVIVSQNSPVPLGGYELD